MRPIPITSRRSRASCSASVDTAPVAPLLRSAFAWGAGHATTLLALGLPLVLWGYALPEHVQQGAEIAIGLLIVGLAVRLLVRWRRGYLHVHPHREALGRTPLAAFGIGLMHGAAGSSGAVLLLIAATGDRTIAALALFVFSAATALSMGLATCAVGHLLTRRHVAPKLEAAIPVLGVLGLLFGAWYALGSLRGGAVWALTYSGRGSLDEREPELRVLDGALRVRQLREQRLQRDAAGLLEWLSDAGEAERLGQFAVVEADDGDVVGDAQAALMRRGQHAAGQDVGAREDRRGRVGSREQVGGSDSRGLGAELDEPDVVVLERDAGVAEAVSKAASRAVSWATASCAGAAVPRNATCRCPRATSSSPTIRPPAALSTVTLVMRGSSYSTSTIATSRATRRSRIAWPTGIESTISPSTRRVSGRRSSSDVASGSSWKTAISNGWGRTASRTPLSSRPYEDDVVNGATTPMRPTPRRARATAVTARNVAERVDRAHDALQRRRATRPGALITSETVEMLTPARAAMS